MKLSLYFNELILFFGIEYGGCSSTIVMRTMTILSAVLLHGDTGNYTFLRYLRYFLKKDIQFQFTIIVVSWKFSYGFL